MKENFRIIMLLVFILISLSAFAGEKPEISLGLKLGMVESDQEWKLKTGPEAENIREKKGLETGVTLDWKIKPSVSILTGFNFVEKGMTLDMYYYNQYGAISGYDYFECVVGYVSIPILLKLSYRYKAFSPYIILGPRFDFKTYYRSGNEYIDAYLKEFKSNMLGYDYGLGFQVLVSKKVSLLFEYSLSLDFSSPYETEEFEVINNVKNVLIGFDVKI